MDPKTALTLRIFVQITHFSGVLTLCHTEIGVYLQIQNRNSDIQTVDNVLIFSYINFKLSFLFILDLQFLRKKHNKTLTK